jgi:CrcB protein
MSFYGFAAVGIGGAFGSCLRWLLGIALNPLSPHILLGTLVANLVGGFLIGLAVEYFLQHDTVPPEVRLFVIVGFLGGLTTFSSFSIEAVETMLDREAGWALALVFAHLAGSLVLTYCGILAGRALNA